MQVPVAEAAAAQSPTPADASAAADAAPQRSPEQITQRGAALDAVGELPLAEHVEVYQRLHAELQSALAEIDGS